MNEDKNEALDNLINSIKEKMSSDNNSNESDNSNFYDFVNNLNNSGNKEKKESNNFNFDPSMILKMQKMMSLMQKDNPKKDLLLSLKPFLRKTRQDKMNDYITILNVLSILESLKNNKGSD